MSSSHPHVRPVVCVTGGAGGIGAATARLFVERGWDVAIVDLPAAASSGASLAAELGGGARAVFIAADVGDPASIAAAFSAVASWRPERLDALVTMAASFIYGTVQSASAEDWEAVCRVNIRGSALCAKAALARMVPARAGAIVLVSSITGSLAFPAFAPYSATKAALEQLARDMALDHGADGVRVNACAPGPIYTQGGTVAHAAREGRPVEELAAELARDVCLRRMGRADECARAVFFLCSEDASYVTGTTLHVDGGFVRK